MAHAVTEADTNAAVEAASRAVLKAAKCLQVKAARQSVLQGAKAQSGVAKEAMRTHSPDQSVTVSPENMLVHTFDKMPQCVVAPTQLCVPPPTQLCVPPRIDGRAVVMDGACPQLWQHMPQQVDWMQSQQQHRQGHPRYHDQHNQTGTAQVPWQQHSMGWRPPMFVQMPLDVKLPIAEMAQALPVRQEPMFGGLPAKRSRHG